MSIMDGIGSMSPGMALGGIASGGLGIIGGGIASSVLGGLAGRGSRASNPLDAPQRQPYQQMLLQLLQGGGKNFLDNDPSVQAQKGMIGDWTKSNFASSGNMPLTSITGSSQLASVFGNQLNQRIQDLMVAGGFSQGNPYGGQPYSSAMGPMNQNMSSMLGGAGSILGGLVGLGSGSGGMPGGIRPGVDPYGLGASPEM